MNWPPSLKQLRWFLMVMAVLLAVLGFILQAVGGWRFITGGFLGMALGLVAGMAATLFAQHGSPYYRVFKVISFLQKPILKAKAPMDPWPTNPQQQPPVPQVTNVPAAPPGSSVTVECVAEDGKPFGDTIRSVKATIEASSYTPKTFILALPPEVPGNIVEVDLLVDEGSVATKLRIQGLLGYQYGDSGAGIHVIDMEV